MTSQLTRLSRSRPESAIRSVGRCLIAARRYHPLVGLSVGERFAGFTVLRPLGGGGMGEVYLVEHPRLPRQEALKILSPTLSRDADYRERFAREADLAAKLWHPNIVEVRDRGETDGQLWISMAYVAGQDAGQLLTSKYPSGMPTLEVIRIINAVADALDYAHSQGLLHRDVKPANIFTSDSATTGEGRVLLGDFGIAREIANSSGLTDTNMTLGTVAYSAPEQLAGEPLDGRADQYALAATAYNLLTGVTLFPLTNPVAVISKQLTASPPRLSTHRPELAGADAVLEKALAKDPADRFSSCSEFARAFADYALDAARTASPTAATEPAPVARGRAIAAPSPQPGTSRSRIIPRAALVIVVALVAGVLIWQPWRHKDESGSGGSPVTDRNAVASGSPSPEVPPRDNPDLALEVALTRPACDGTGIVILGSASTPGRYKQDVQRMLRLNPGASYLRTDLSCPSLRQESAEGTPIYAVYRVAGMTNAQVCAGVAEAGEGTYGKWLDTTSAPDEPIDCAPKGPPQGAITDVDPATYQVPGRTDFYLWAFSTSPLRECGIFETGTAGASQFGVSCDVSFPPGTPASPNSPFKGNPNQVRMVPPDKPEFMTEEGGVEKGRVMMPNRRITVGNLSCTTLVNGGVECTSPSGGFRYDGQTLTTS